MRARTAGTCIRRWIPPLLAIVAAPSSARCATQIRTIVHTPAEAHAFEKIEITFRLGRAYTNP